ncbi:MAG TPA: nucleotide exchange factor GrpE [Phycisphaeraceae bacterium]
MMNEQDRQEPQPQPQQGGPEQGPTEQELGQRVERDVEEALAAVERERDELQERLLRIAADYQNYVRRADQNALVAREQQLIEVARSLATVLDHFDHALEVDPEKTSAKSLLDGMIIVRDELLKTLAKFDIQRLEVEPGESFDPNRHEALMRQPSQEVAPNHVIAQLRPGYLFKDKVVRPVQVSVAQ